MSIYRTRKIRGVYITPYNYRLNKNIIGRNFLDVTRPTNNLDNKAVVSALIDELLKMTLSCANAGVFSTDISEEVVEIEDVVDKIKNRTYSRIEDLGDDIGYLNQSRPEFGLNGQLGYSESLIDESLDYDNASDKFNKKAEEYNNDVSRFSSDASNEQDIADQYEAAAAANENAANAKTASATEKQKESDAKTEVAEGLGEEASAKNSEAESLSQDADAKQQEANDFSNQSQEKSNSATTKENEAQNLVNEGNQDILNADNTIDQADKDIADAQQVIEDNKMQEGNGDQDIDTLRQENIDKAEKQITDANKRKEEAEEAKEKAEEKFEAADKNLKEATQLKEESETDAKQAEDAQTQANAKQAEADNTKAEADDKQKQADAAQAEATDKQKQADGLNNEASNLNTKANEDNVKADQARQNAQKLDDKADEATDKAKKAESTASTNEAEAKKAKEVAQTTAADTVDKNYTPAQQDQRGNCWFHADYNGLRNTEWGQKLLDESCKDDGNGGKTITFGGAARDEQKEWHVSAEELAAARNNPKYSKGNDQVLAYEIAMEKYLTKYSGRYQRNKKDVLSGDARNIPYFEYNPNAHGNLTNPFFSFTNLLVPKSNTYRLYDGINNLDRPLRTFEAKTDNYAAWVGFKNSEPECGTYAGHAFAVLGMRTGTNGQKYVKLQNSVLDPNKDSADAHFENAYYDMPASRRGQCFEVPYRIFRKNLDMITLTRNPNRKAA